ncbi:MAG: ABC transporter permease [bacterium]|nr:ABC transporter permease [bacterium]
MAQNSTTNNQQPTTNNESWTEIITSKSPLFDLKLKEVWKYRDLVYMFIRKDLVVQYKQTILGPAWYLIQPLITTLMFTVIFGHVAKIPTNGIPNVLFYLAGLTCWNYFSKSVTVTSDTFITNQAVFGKVYFPRMVVPISVVISNLIIFIIQFCLFMAFYFYYYFEGAAIHMTAAVFLLPLLLLLMIGLSVGFGLLFSSFTTKYRDLKFLLAFIVQIWMYATPIIYPLSSISEKHRWIIVLNPMTSIISTFKYSFMGKGIFDWYYLLYSFVFMIVLLFIGIVLFNRVEKNFMDTV